MAYRTNLPILLSVLFVVACSESYEKLLAQGIAERHARNWERAKKLLFEAAAKKPTAEVFKEIGNVFLLGDQNIAEAENYYRKALALDPEYTNAQFNMAVVYVKKYEETLDDKGHGDTTLLDEADRWFTKVYSKNPNFAVGLEERAKYYFYRHDYKKALETAQQALVLNNRNSNAHSVIGQIYYTGLKDYQQAFEHFEKARALNSKDADVIFFLWATSEKLAKTQDAKQYKIRYEQMLKEQGLSDAQAKERIRRLENQLKS